MELTARFYHSSHFQSPLLVVETLIEPNFCFGEYEEEMQERKQRQKGGRKNKQTVEVTK